MPSGKSYYVSFTDDNTRYTCVYLQSAKSNTFESYKTYEAWLQTQHNAKVKRLRSDRGGEYLSDEFSKHLKAQGMERKLTTHDTPQHNGAAERLNRTLIKRVRAVLYASRLLKNLWGEAIKHTVYIKNCTATRTLDGKTPYEMLHGKKLNLKGLPVWGTKVWVHDPSGGKLDMRAHEGHWIGFDAETGAHRVYFTDCYELG
jgi:transposase InsO family protein